MAQFISGGAYMFDTMLYGAPHPGTINFIRERMENITPALQTASQEFYDRARGLYEAMAGHDAMRAMRAAGRAIRAAWQDDAIRPLDTIGELQHAPLIMRRWLMAEPTIRKLYHQQRVDGYSDTYIDAEPGKIGEDHSDYCRVMSGMLVFDEQPNADGEYGWSATTYSNDLEEDGPEFTIDEQADLVNTWSVIRAYARNGKEDPTSRFAADMG